MAGKLKNKFKTGQEALIHALFMHNGGVQRVASMLGMTKQKLNEWRAAGHVPLKYCGLLGRALECPVFSFNYKDCIMFFGTDAVPSWKKVVTGCRLPPDTVENIFTYPEPELDD